MTRKERSEEKLRRHRIPINPHLPKIESEEDANLRSPTEIARRAVALCAVAMRGEGLDREEADGFLRDHDCWDAVTPKEKSFLLNPSPADKDRITFTWRYECLWVLLWTLGHFDQLSYPSSICDAGLAVQILIDQPKEQFIAQARTRPLSEILDEADLIYRYDWAVVNARINEQMPPGGLDPGVVYERHYALNWLVGYMEQEWDEITTDT